LFGILNVYKPKGMTSHDVVSFVRRNLHIKRVGHTGTLDPDAEGVLPILVGKATKLSDLLTAEEKQYIARVCLGVVTDTDDASGTILETKTVAVKENDVKEAVAQFLGDIEQIPPMYSAIKVGGKKLYQLARQGVVTERKARKVTIHSASVSNFDGTSFDLAVHCSKGTYIRALCRDIGAYLKTGACMSSLIRTKSGMFCKENAVTLHEIEQAVKNGTVEELLILPDDVLSHLKSVKVQDESAVKIKNGIRLRPEQLGMNDFLEEERFRIYHNQELFCILKVIRENEQYVLAMDKSFYES